MNIHEYQAKIVLQEYGITVPDFYVVSSVAEAEQVLKDTGLQSAVVKVQIHAGGRGKAGGVKIAKSPQDIIKAVKQLVGMRITNSQTGPDGIVAEKVLISPLIEYKQEYYVGAIIDRHNAQAMLIVSPDGGMEIEEIAEKTPDRIRTFPITNSGDLRNFQLIEIAKFMGWAGTTAEQGKKLLKGLAKAFVKTDAALLEINPLVQTANGDIVALDAKLTIDDNAIYRQPEISAFYDKTQIPPNESRAKEFDLAYIALDGEIGCMVNGAGLAMATMDIIQHYGGMPANFLDVGGGATQEKVAEGFKILLSDPKVKAILVNIFGGIMNCATLATGIIAATTELKVKVPLIVRMEGTNVEQGKKLLKESGLAFIIADTLADAAQKAVAAAKA